MNHPLSKSAQSVQDALDALGAKSAPLQVVELPQTTRTANDAAAAIGCEVGQIVKSLIFKMENAGKPVLVLVSGPNRVNEKSIAAHVGGDIVKADADFVRAVTGFAIGGIPPVGHARFIADIFIDEDLLAYEYVWAAAGTPNAVFKLKSDDLMHLTNGKTLSVK